MMIFRKPWVNIYFRMNIWLNLFKTMHLPCRQGQNHLSQVGFLWRSYVWHAISQRSQREWTLNSSPPTSRPVRLLPVYLWQPAGRLSLLFLNWENIQIYIINLGLKLNLAGYINNFQFFEEHCREWTIIRTNLVFFFSSIQRNR